MSDEPRTLGPIRLAPGVERRHVLCYLVAAFLSIGLFTYLTALTPYVLKVNLQVPESGQGRITGNLQFWQEILVLIVVGAWGAVADRYGRRAVYAIAFLWLAAGYVLYPLAATLGELTFARLFWGTAIAGLSVLLATVNQDYPAEQSRSKLTGLAFMLNGLGSVAFFIGLTRLPQWFAARGAAPVEAGRYAYFVAAGIALFAAVVMLGLRPGRPPGNHGRRPLRRLAAEGLAAARNPRVALAYGSAFAARADMAIITLFVTLWVVQSATAAGDSAAMATVRAGAVIGTAQLAALFGAPLFGFIGDRIDRLSFLLVAFTIAAVGYGWVGSLDDLRGPAAVPALVCLGLGLSATSMSSTVLLGQAAPAEVRGSAFGLQTFCGGLGILAISEGGGRLFDGIGPGAPFVAVAVANTVVLALGIALRLRERRTAAAARAPA